MSPGGPILILVPSARELTGLRALATGVASLSLELCGVGPVLAAARSAQLLARCRPEGVLLLGVAGSFDGAVFRPGCAYRFGGATLHGVGVGSSENFQAASSMGLSQWPGDEQSGAIGEDLCWDDKVARPWLLTVCSASSTLQESAARRQRAQACVAEEMEAFAVAAACALQGVKLAVLRGISNLAGERAKEHWCIDQALASLWPLAQATLAEHTTWKVPRASGQTR